ncbi:MAG TPA: glycosyl hydrolase family 28-related protein [Candidatus Acidoferrum sp.]|nr:glycosyl hydrolase family 28-related protein [Candidatus Acidoferrum sp.]
MTPGTASAQGSRKDDIVLSASGHPIPGATIRVCEPTAAGDPCNPLATIYTDATLTTTAPNPFQGDGIGNYYFYAPAGRYMIQISGPGITGTRTYPDVILAPDVSSSGAGNDISAFGLTLGGNLTVGGNATINGTLTTTNFNPGTFTPSSLSVSGNETVLGPRPRVDVTAYGAKGDNSTDDTAAIQAAINAVCAYGTVQRPTLFFPPGIYVVSQPQGGSSNTSPVFTGWCSHLMIQGSGGNATAQFAMAPMSHISVKYGANPGAGPVFEPTSNAGSESTIRDLSIDSYNQAVYLIGTSGGDLNGFTFDDVCLSTQTTGDADNVPLKISQALQVSFMGGCLQAGNGSLDDVLIIGADFGGTEVQPSGLLFFDGTGGNFWIGSGIHYDQRVNTCCSGPGNIHVRNVLVESPTQAIFRVTNSTGNSGATAMPSVVNFNSSGSVLSGLHMKGDGPGSNSPIGAVVMQAGGLSNCDIRGGGIGISLTTVVDGNGNLLGDCTEQSSTGIVSVVNTSNTNRLRTDPGPSSDGSSLEAFAAGNSFSSLNIDPKQGLMLGDGASYGYNAQLYQPTKGTIDVGFASTLPPTNVTTTATTGGGLAAGTYYYFIRSTTNADAVRAACRHLRWQALRLRRAGQITRSRFHGPRRRRAQQRTWVTAFFERQERQRSTTPGRNTGVLSLRAQAQRVSRIPAVGLAAAIRWPRIT